MSTYTNKFTLEVSSVVRIVFQDEWIVLNTAPAPPPTKIVAEVILLRENAIALKDLLVKML